MYETFCWMNSVNTTFVRILCSFHISRSCRFTPLREINSHRWSWRRSRSTENIHRARLYTVHAPCTRNSWEAILGKARRQTSAIRAFVEKIHISCSFIFSYYRRRFILYSSFKIDNKLIASKTKHFICLFPYDNHIKVNVTMRPPELRTSDRNKNPSSYRSIRAQQQRPPKLEQEAGRRRLPLVRRKVRLLCNQKYSSSINVCTSKWILSRVKRIAFRSSIYFRNNYSRPHFLNPAKLLHFVSSLYHLRARHSKNRRSSATSL